MRRAFSLFSLSCLLAFCVFAPAWAQEEKKEASDPAAEYQSVDLAALVPASRMKEGQGRAIFAPRAVRFQARLAQKPKPQKSDYLKEVMGMMGITPLPEVRQRIALEYGGDKPLAAYVEVKVAARIDKELKVGDNRTFYAFHVYNNRFGPAFVITSFGD
ncbi:MAG: hypothetical protein LBO79_04740 [Zoogloeaceae bacterium]|nr:hypothetical protein [Zoogloeaceae bacterium]